MYSGRPSMETKTVQSFIGLAEIIRWVTKDPPEPVNGKKAWLEYTRFRNVTNWSIMADFQSLKHCIVA